MFVCQVFLKQSHWLLFLFCWQTSKMQITSHFLSFHIKISLSTRRFCFSRFFQSWKLILFHVKAISLQVFTRDMQSKKPCLRDFVKEIMTIFVGFVNSNLSASMTTKKIHTHRPFYIYYVGLRSDQPVLVRWRGVDTKRRS